MALVLLWSYSTTRSLKLVIKNVEVDLYHLRPRKRYGTFCFANHLVLKIWHMVSLGKKAQHIIYLLPSYIYSWFFVVYCFKKKLILYHFFVTNLVFIYGSGVMKSLEMVRNCQHLKWQSCILPVIVTSVCTIVTSDTMVAGRATFLWNNSTICHHNRSTMTGSIHDYWPL